MEEKRILCLDVGNVRIGIAISDPTGLLAQPVGTYTRVKRDADIEYIAGVIADKGVSLIVSGLPLLLDGTEGEQAQKTRSFVNRLARKTGLPVEFMDERFSTSSARSIQKQSGISTFERKDTIDTIAATFILQNYLDKINNK